MHRLYFGLVLLGTSVSANAEEMVKSGFSSRFDQSTIQTLHYIPYFISHNKYEESVVFIVKADNTSVDSLFNSTSQPSSVAEQKEETITKILGQHDDLGRKIGTLLLHKSVELSGEKLKVTFQPDYASMETGQFKLSLEPGSTSIMWNKAI